MKLKLFISYLFVILFPVCLFSQIPSAEVFSNDTAFCESGNALFKVRFTGTPPFAFAYQIDSASYTEDGGGNIFGDTFELSSSLTASTEIVLMRVYDNGYQLDPENPMVSGSDNVTGSMKVQVDEMPLPNAGVDKDNCGLSYALQGQVTNEAHTIWWDDMSPNGSFDDINSPTAIFTGTLTGSYTLTLNEENGTCLASDVVDITLLGTPTGEITAGDFEFCSSDGIDDYVSVEINFTGVGDYTYVMQNNSGTYAPVTTANTNETIPYAVTSSDSFTLFSVEDGNGCMAHAVDLTGMQTASDLKPNTFAGDDDLTCSQLYTLQANAASGATGVWTTTTGGIDFINEVSSTTSVTSSSYQFAELVWTEDRGGCISSDAVTINFAEPPGLSLSVADDHICEDVSSFMNVVLTGNAPWVFNYQDGNNTYTEANISGSAHSVELAPNVDTEYNLIKVTGNYGCETSYNDLVYTVLVDELPQANAGADTVICGKIISLNGEPSIGDGEWTGSGIFDDSTDPYATFTANEFGTHLLTWTEVNGLCTDEDEVSVYFQIAPYPVDAGVDTLIYATDNLQLSAAELQVGNGVWTLEEGNADIEFPSVHNTRLLNIQTGTHRLIWTASIVDGTCPDITDEIVIVSKELFSPTGFSPNSDLLNQTFMILGVDNITNHKLMVFDKNGKEVYSSINYENDWDGKDKAGQDLPEGTYYYVFDGDQLSKPIKNYLIIKR